MAANRDEHGADLRRVALSRVSGERSRKESMLFGHRDAMHPSRDRWERPMPNCSH